MLQMKYRRRIYYSDANKALMWDRWQAGDSLGEIARLFDRRHSSVRGIIERCGGMRPPTRRRSARALTLAEREEISRGIAAGRSLRSIAPRLGAEGIELRIHTIGFGVRIPRTVHLTRSPGFPVTVHLIWFVEELPYQKSNLSPEF
jgi:hypothetical protein